MTIATNQRLTLEEYLNHDDGTNTRYELVDGELVEMPAESDINVLIAIFLTVMFSRQIPYFLVRRGTEVFVTSRSATSRYPDLMVLTEAGRVALEGSRRSVVTSEMPPPALVVEVVSNSDSNKESRDRDYLEKRSEYAAREIPEYWIIDPIAGLVTVCVLGAQVYDALEFRGSAVIGSRAFPMMLLTAEQVLKAGM